MNQRTVLVASGDYTLIEQVRGALNGRGFTVASALSHRDTLYFLRQHSYDLALIDAQLSERQHGVRTLHMVAGFSLRPPLVALALNGTSGSLDALPADVVITDLDDDTIQRSVVDALKMPQVSEPPQTARTTILNWDELRQRDTEIQTLFTLSRSLTEVLNLPEVLNRVVEAARRLTDADEGMILLPDDDDPHQLWLRARVGIDVETARNFRVKTQDTLAGSVYHSGKTLLINAQGPQKVKTEYFVNALLYVPISLQGKTLGVLGVNNKDKHDVFNKRHQELLENLSSFAAIAIENARAHEDSLKRARELRALVDASRVINSSLALEQALPNICAQLIDMLNVNLSEILEWDRERGQLRTLARYHRTIWRPGCEPLIDMAARPLIRAVLERRRAVYVTTRSDSPEEVAHLRRVGAGAALILPIMVTGAMVGIVQAYFISTPENPLTEDAMRAAERSAVQTYLELANANSAAAYKEQVRRVLDLNATLDADWAEMSYMLPDANTLRTTLAVGRGVWLSPPYPSLNLTQYPDLAAALEDKAPFSAQIDDESASTPGAAALLAATRSRSVLGVPLVNRGVSTGLVVFADSEHASAFSAHELDLARAIVGQAATALENAHLVHDLEVSLRELKETQGRLIQAARLSAMGELAAAVAHQVNNPLTTIVLDTELMLLSETPGSPRYESLDAIVRAGKRAAGVVRRLLAAARPTDPDAPMRPVDVVATVEDVVALIRSHIQRSKVKFGAVIPNEPLPPVLAGAGELDDVWLNLLLNAHDALQGREDAAMGIEVLYHERADYIDVVVWDNGPGIPSPIIDEIFKPFFTTKPVGEGTGLGLHICRQVVERVGGQITVESAVNAGTRFKVHLPIMREV